MPFYYLLPIVLIALAFAYSRWAAKNAVAAAQNLSPEEAARRFHDHYSGYFDVAAGETIVGAWSGVDFLGASSTGAQLAGAALNAASAAVIGVSRYVPNIHVGLTSTGRVLVSREHSVAGQRDNYEQIVALEAGTRALDARAAGIHPGAAPKNPYNPMVALEFVQLRAPGGAHYEAWMSPQGGRQGYPGFCSIQQGLGNVA